MKKLFILLTIIVILPAFTLKTAAEESVDGYLTDLESILPDSLRGITSDSDKLTDSLGIDAIFRSVADSLAKESSGVSGFFLSLVGMTALLAIPLPFGDKISSATRATLGVMLAVMIFTSLSPIFAEVSNALDSVSSFFASVIPIAVGITSLGGGVATAGVQATGMFTTAALVGRVASVILLPISGFGFAMSLCSAFGSDGPASLIKGIKSLFAWIIGILTALIGGTLSLQTMISAAQDSAAMRAARYMASGLIPVVGSTVSGALSTLATGVSYAKGVVGGGAILAMLSIVASPLLSLLCYRFALSAAAIISEMLGRTDACGILSAFRFSLDALTAVYALSSIIYIWEIILFVKAGVALL